MTPEQRRIRGADAQALLDNPMLRDAFAAVAEHLEQQAQSCDQDNAEKARRIIIAKQILSGIKREIERVVKDGEVAQIELSEIEQRRRLFRR